VILQTYNIALPALLMAKKQDYKNFFLEEIEARKAYEYPPYSQIIRVVAACENSELAQLVTEQLAEELSNYLEDKVDAEAVKILGPAPCLIERLRGKYRFHIIIKNLAGDEGRRLVTHFLRHHRGHSGLSIAVDIEAVDLI
jgi:primosomal protein N' (replication factor Y) (superfamily II helicase)